jgi:arsenate reductase-like glutaredoxin family protein
MDVQIFGIKKSPETRSALRFFAERRIKVHFVDFTVRPPARGELQRFAQKFGAAALIDRTSKRFQERGLGPALYSDDRWLDLLSADPLLLRMPLVRFGRELTIGAAPATWAEWKGTDDAS